jgi:hypothetical protein
VSRDDYYALLGVPRDATEMEIRSAYGRAALAQQVSGASAIDASLRQALDVLTDPERRRAYDAELAPSDLVAAAGAGTVQASGVTADMSATQTRRPLAGPLGFVLGLVRRFPIWTAIGLFALLGFLFRDYLSSDVTELKVGDCFDLPAGITKTATVKDVQHHPCTDLHVAEMVFVGNVPDPGSAYPGDVGFQSFVKAQCVPAYNSYTGRDFDTDQTYDMSFLVPTTDGWAKGDHALQCFAVRSDGTSFKGTIKAAR